MLWIRSNSRAARRLLGAVLSAACLSVSCGASAAPVSWSPVVTPVADGPARGLGEPAAAQNPAVSAVVATSFGGPGPRALAWTRPSGSAGWSAAGSVLPHGFGSSYDASAASAPGGPVLLVAGASPPGEGCIGNGSVAISTVRSDGRLSPARLVSDQRGTGSFDDRPSVAAGPGGTVWVAWSEGPDANACQNVGTGDHLEAAVSHDDGQTFGAPTALPAIGGDSAFGARLVPLRGGRAAVSWTERFGGGRESVLVSVLGPDGRPSPPRRVLTGAAPPLTLPGASFYDFPAGDITALPGGLLAVAAPLWSGQGGSSGHAVIGLAAGTPDGPWKASSVAPPRGADLLLPALAAVSADTLRLLCAVHFSSGDRLGYDQADLRVPAAASSSPAAPSAVTGLTPVTPAPNGPGFFEIGEELIMTRAPGGLLAPVIVAGGSGARLETLTWGQAATPGSPATPAARGVSSVRPSPVAMSGRAAARSGSAQASSPASPAAPAARQGPGAAATWWVPVLLGASAIALGAWLFRRLSARD